MHTDNDGDLFAGVPPLGLLDERAGTGQFPSRAELDEMPRAFLVEYAEALQKECVRFDGENKFLNWEAQSSLSFFSRAAKLAHCLNASSIDTIVSTAIGEVAGFFGCAFAAMFVRNPETRRFDLAGVSRDPGVSSRERDGRDAFLEKLFASRSEAYIVDYNAETHCLEFEDGECFACGVRKEWAALVNGRAMVFPLKVRREDNAELTLGGLILGDADNTLEGRDAEAAQFFADILSASLHNAQLVERLNQMTIIDPLTNIYNRRHLLDQLGTSMLLADRHGHDLCIAMLDIDFFKNVNDEYGHICGDEVLRAVASVLRSGLRTGGDLAARYGGEEFLLVMPFTGLSIAVDVAERLRLRLRDHRVETEGRALGVTCSLGVTQYVTGESLETLVSRADAALYKAKNGGRDQVVAVAGA